MMLLGRIIVPLISPLPIALIFLMVGLGFGFFKKRRVSLILTGMGIMVLLFFGYGIFTKNALYRLEHQYPPLIIQQLTQEVKEKICYVVVLGSGHISDPKLPTTAQIGGDSLYRLIEGIRVHRQLPWTRLIISGGKNINDPIANATVVSDVAVKIGISPDDLIIEDRPRDTFEEAKLLQTFLGEKPFVLVTSAAHMDRAVKVFENFGMRPLPAPTNYTIRRATGSLVDSWLPSCGNLSISRRIFYEWMGKIWIHLKRAFESSQ